MTVNLKDTLSFQSMVTQKNNGGEQMQRGRIEYHRTLWEA
jgi:hypothetical protein